jgi:hypothetical protein
MLHQFGRSIRRLGAWSIVIILVAEIGAKLLGLQSHSMPVSSITTQICSPSALRMAQSR